MAHVAVQEDLDLESPAIVEGMPGVGLVGKIATDHLIDEIDMTYYAACHCDGIADVSVYEQDDYTLRPPVRIYADETQNLLALQSDIPVSPNAASEFTNCLVAWFEEHDVMPICLSGLPEEKDGVPTMYGVGVGGGTDRLAVHEIDTPGEGGLIRGPTGALLAEANQVGLDSVGLIVQANAKFPDPEAARVLLAEGIAPIADIEVDTQELVDHAEEIAAARENLAKQMQQAEEESSQAQPLGMYH